MASKKGFKIIKCDNGIGRNVILISRAGNWRQVYTYIIEVWEKKKSKIIKLKDKNGIMFGPFAFVEYEISPDPSSNYWDGSWTVPVSQGGPWITTTSSESDNIWVTTTSPDYGVDYWISDGTGSSAVWTVKK